MMCFVGLQKVCSRTSVDICVLYLCVICVCAAVQSARTANIHASGALSTMSARTMPLAVKRVKMTSWLLEDRFAAYRFAHTPHCFNSHFFR